MIDLANTVFLVDGKTEISSFRGRFYREFGCSPEFRKVQCNGRSVTPEGYANAAHGTLLILLRQHFKNIICIADRETRRISALRLAEAIKGAAVQKIASSTRYAESELNDKIKVCVPDIMFENWIVADIEGIKRFTELVVSHCEQCQYDGKSGVSVLREVMKIPYRKTLHGPKLFNAVIFNNARRNSPSFHNFALTIDL